MAAGSPSRNSSSLRLLRTERWLASTVPRAAGRLTLWPSEEKETSQRPAGDWRWASHGQWEAPDGCRAAAGARVPRLVRGAAIT
eukprot:scaffold20297_cov47-Phaeocystis_antarctica.AAC.1